MKKVLSQDAIGFIENKKLVSGLKENKKSIILQKLRLRSFFD
jgi:hypothetical protein